MLLPIYLNKETPCLFMHLQSQNIFILEFEWHNAFYNICIWLSACVCIFLSCLENLKILSDDFFAFIFLIHLISQLQKLTLIFSYGNFGIVPILWPIPKDKYNRKNFFCQQSFVVEDFTCSIIGESRRLLFCL